MGKMLTQHTQQHLHQKEKPLTSEETREVRNKIRQIRSKKQLRRDNRKKGLINNIQIEKEIQDLQNEVAHSIAEMRQKEMEEKISCIEKLEDKHQNGK